MMRTNSQNRKSRIAKREEKIRKNSRGVSNWNESYIEGVLSKNNIDNYFIKDNSQGIVITTRFSYWYVNHDNKVVTLRHSNFATQDSNTKLRGSYHKQDVFYTLNQCIEYIVKHEGYKGSRKL